MTGFPQHEEILVENEANTEWREPRNKERQNLHLIICHLDAAVTEASLHT